MTDFATGPDAPARHRFAVALAALVAVVLPWAPPASAQPQPSAPTKRAPVESPGPSWQSLSPQQRAALAPLQDEWASIDAPRKAKWLDIAARYPRLPPSEQQRLQARMSEWSQMTPNERARARMNYQEVKQLPQQERHDQWEAYQALPENQRKELASRNNAGTQAKAPKPVTQPPAEPGVKRNIVPNPSHSVSPSRPVAPTVVQSSPGATTTLVTRQPAPPTHQQAGMPKITATPGFVDRNTLLPKRGPQGAGMRPAGSASAARP